MIQVIDRRLKIPNRIIGYSGDNLVEVRTFELNRMYGDIDLAQFDFKLDTEINGVKNIIDLVKSVTEDKITLTWTVRESHILYPGRMNIQIRAFNSASGEKWHSAQDYVLVQASINATPLPFEFIQMVVEEGQNWEEEVFLTIAAADIVRAISVEEGQYWEGVK